MKVIAGSSRTRLLTCTPAGVQRQVRGPDCAENRGVSAGTALGRVCLGSSGQVFQPSIIKSSW